MSVARFFFSISFVLFLTFDFQSFFFFFPLLSDFFLHLEFTEGENNDVVKALKVELISLNVVISVE